MSNKHTSDSQEDPGNSDHSSGSVRPIVRSFDVCERELGASEVKVQRIVRRGTFAGRRVFRAENLPGFRIVPVSEPIFRDGGMSECMKALGGSMPITYIVFEFSEYDRERNPRYVLFEGAIYQKVWMNRKMNPNHQRIGANRVRQALRLLTPNVEASERSERLS